jgi:lipopolysaccharide export system protein LptC
MTLVRQLWERLALYLPVVLMGVLAMATYWLVRSMPLAESVAAVVSVQHLPDYFMRGFSVKTFDAQGHLKSEVTGAEARHFPDTDMLEIDQVVIRSFDPQGHLTTATAQRALTDSDASEVQLMGGAHVVRAAGVDATGKQQPELSFAGEYLHAFMKAERVTSSQPVVLTRGQNRFTADRMDFDNLKRVMQLEGRVKGVLVPAAKQ